MLCRTSPYRSTCTTASVFVLVLILGGCGPIKFEKPLNNDRIVLPSPNAIVSTPVVVRGLWDYRDLKVLLDSVDVTSAMVPNGPRLHQGTVSVGQGSHTLKAIATIDCIVCTNGTALAFDSSTFVATPIGSSCQRSETAPTLITLDASIIDIGQRPGKQRIAYQAKNGDGILIVVEDAPGLPRTKMRVEVDLDPTSRPRQPGGVTWAKSVQAWQICPAARLRTIYSVKLEQDFLSCDIDANTERSGCTATQTMVIDQVNVQELWLRKPVEFGNWVNVEAIDASIWKAFGGRSVRFVWLFD